MIPALCSDRNLQMPGGGGASLANSYEGTDLAVSNAAGRAA